MNDDLPTFYSEAELARRANRTGAAMAGLRKLGLIRPIGRLGDGTLVYSPDAVHAASNAVRIVAGIVGPDKEEAAR